MNLYVVRHGQTNWNLEHILQGSSDIPLNAKGLEEAHTVAELLKNIPFDIIYSSPLDRAFQTATCINHYHNLDIITDNLLIERNFGTFEGTKLLKNISDYWDYELNINDDNIENIQLFFQRINRFLLKIYQAYGHTNYNILVVAHQGVNIAINAIITNHFADLLSFAINNCEYKLFQNVKLKT